MVFLGERDLVYKCSPSDDKDQCYNAMKHYLWKQALSKKNSELDKQVVIHVLYSIIYVNMLNWDGQVRREYDTTIVSLI